MSEGQLGGIAKTFALSRNNRAGTHAAELTDADRVRTLYRWVLIGILMSLFWKASYYPLAYELYGKLLLEDPFFPIAFRSPYVLAALMGLPITLSILCIFVAHPWLFRIQAAATTACLAGLCWHQGSYNDVTFLTCFWASLLGLWMVLSFEKPWEQILPRAQMFAILIVSLMFAGGAVGKYTPAYWSGDVLYQIYFVDRPFWFFDQLRTHMDDASLRSFATLYSRVVILVETACAFLWLMPRRIAGWIGLITLCGIVVFSNINLLSVMFCLFALCGIAIYQPANAKDQPDA